MMMFIRIITYVLLIMLTHCYHEAKMKDVIEVIGTNAIKSEIDKKGNPSSATRRFYDDNPRYQQQVNGSLKTSNFDSNNDFLTTKPDNTFEKTKNFEKKYQRKLWHTK